jgi:EpsI family protein
MTKLAVAFAFLALNAYTYHWMARERVIPPRESFASFPLDLGEWSCSGFESVSAEIRKNLGATDYMICEFRRGGPPDAVGVYVGYHESQVREEGGGAGENAIHPPAHCLPGSGWDIIANETVPLDMPGLPEQNAHVKRLIIAKGEARQLVYYWYQSQGRVIAEDWKKIAYVGWDRATRGRTDGSLVRFTIPVYRGDEARAERAFRELGPRVVKELPPYVPS